MKGIPFERRVVNLLKDGGEQHAASVPRAEPVAAGAGAGDRRRPARAHVTQSMAIIGYLEERFPAPPLLPADPWLRARARQLARDGERRHPAAAEPVRARIACRRAGSTENEWARHFIARGLAALEAAAHETAGSVPGRRAPTIADAYLVPQLYTARRFNVDLAPFPTLVRIEAACAALPAFAAAHPDAQSDAPAASKS